MEYDSSATDRSGALGKGAASRALATLLRVVTERPIHAHVATHDVSLIRVQESEFTFEQGLEVDEDGVADLMLVPR